MSAEVTHAFWHGHSQYEIELELNHIEKAVIGKFSEGRWFIYENTQRHPASWARQYDYESEEAITGSLPLNSGPITANVIVFNPYNSDIYLKETFRISLVAENACQIEKVI